MFNTEKKNCSKLQSICRWPQLYSGLRQRRHLLCSYMANISWLNVRNSLWSTYCVFYRDGRWNRISSHAYTSAPINQGKRLVYLLKIWSQRFEGKGAWRETNEGMKMFCCQSFLATKLFNMFVFSQNIKSSFFVFSFCLCWLFAFPLCMPCATMVPLCFECLFWYRLGFALWLWWDRTPVPLPLPPIKWAARGPPH